MLSRTLLLLFTCASAGAQTPTQGAQTPAQTPLKSLFFGDLDADGRDDAFVVQPDGSTRLLMNQGDGSFLDVTERAGLADATGAHMALFGDVDGDGRADLYLPAWRGVSRLMLQAEPGSFIDGTESAGLPTAIEPIDAAWKDVDGDGIDDLWLTTALDDLVYRADGRGQFEKLDLGLAPRAGALPETLEAARAGRGLPPLGPTPPGGGGSTAGAPGPGTQPICTIYMQDQANPSICLMASSDPTFGMLYPISSDWFVSAGTGFTGLGTTTPSQQLHVAGNTQVDGTVIVTGGGAPFQVSSSALNTNLNADLLDGLHASAFAQLPIDGSQLGPDSVSGIHVVDDSLTAADIGENAIENSELAANAVRGPNIADASISSADLGVNSVGSSQLANDSVDSASIIDGAVTGDDVLNGSLTALDLAPGSVTSSELAANSVGTVAVIDNSLTQFDLAPDSVTSSELAIGSVGSPEVLDDSLTSADLAANSVTSSELAANSVTSSELAANSVTSSELATDAVGSNEVINESLTGIDIQNGTLTGNDISDGSIQSPDLGTNSVGPTQLAAGAVFNVNVSNLAAIDGFKVVPSFGSQDISTIGIAHIGNGTSNPPFKVKGDGGFDADGYLGVQGAVDFEGVLTADWLGKEIGVAGISDGTTNSDNFGVLGHSNYVGVRGEHSLNPQEVFAELGRSGVGLRASGTTLAGEFLGDVSVTGNLVGLGDVSVTGNLVGLGDVSVTGNLELNADTALRALDSTNAGLGNAARFSATNVTSTAPSLISSHAGLGSAASFSQSSSAAIFASLYTSSKGTSVSHRTLHAVNMGSGQGQAAFIDLNNTGSSGVSAWVRNRGSGTALYVEHEGSPTRTIEVDKNVQTHVAGADMIEIQILDGSSDASQFVEFQRGSDIKFRVDGDGDVFADGAFTGPADFAEMLRVSSGYATTEAGDVVTIDPDSFRSVEVSSEPYSRLVAGVYSTKPGFVGSEREFAGAIGPDGERLPLKRSDMAELYDEVPIAVVGIVPCKVSVENGAIRPGDLLVTSTVPGHAMVDNDPPVGTVVGKSLEAYDGTSGRTGVIRILVTLQ